MTAEEFLAQTDSGLSANSGGDTATATIQGLVNNNPPDEADQFLSQVDQGLEKLNPQTKYATPKTWFGEAKFGLSRGIDELQQMLYGGAALATTGNLHQKFLQAVKQQDEEIASSPASIPTYEGVHSFDSFMRYFSGGLGEMAPQIGQSIAAGAIGSVAGSAAAPGAGTAVGAIGGLIEKQAIRNLIKSGIEETAKTELKSFAEGQIGKQALSETAKGLLVNETKNLGAKYGAFGAIAANSWGQEAASIYTDLESDPNVPETDKRLSSLVGGFIAAIPDAGFEGWIASKFFPGAHAVKEAAVKDAENYAIRFMKTYGKELIKVAPAEGAQEYAQTLIEEASKNYADPTKRDAIFNFTPEQKTSFVDAMFKGAIGGVLGAGVSGIAETRINPQAHPNPEVRQDVRDIEGKANDIAPPVPTKEDVRVSEITARQEEINAELIKPEITPEQKQTLEEEHAKLEEEANQLLGKPLQGLVNNNQQQGATGFQTSKGSTYTIQPDKTTIRNKSVHPEHPGDEGLKPKSDTTFYVNPEQLDKLGEVQTTGIGKKTLRQLPDGSWGVYYLDGPDSGKFEKRTVTDVSTEPAVGLVPVELWKDSNAPHFGNPITEVFTEPQKEENRPSTEGSITQGSNDLNSGLLSSQKAQIEPPVALTEDQLPKREVFERIAPNITPEEFLAKKQQRDDLVNKIVEAHPNKEEGQIFRQAIERALPDEALMMLADQGVNITQAKPGSDEVFAVSAGPRGNISLRIPSIKKLLGQVKTLSSEKYSGITLTKGDKNSYLNAMDSVMTHELVHVAHFVSLRQDWIKEGKPGTFSEYQAIRAVEIGKSLRALGKDFRFRELFKSIPMLGQMVYNYGGFGSVDNQTLGNEIPRMAAELARTGRIDEFTGALVRLQSESEGPKKDKISTFLQKWIQAIKGIQKVLANLINPKTSSEQFQTAFNNINKVLDQYGVLVNESAKKEQETLQQNKQKNEDLKSETVDTAAEKANTAKSFRETAQATPAVTGETRQKGKAKNVTEEASQPARAAQPSGEIPSKYTPASKSISGKIFTGSDHEESLSKLQSQTSIADSTPAEGGRRGYVTKDGEFLSLIEVAKRESTAKSAEPKKDIRALFAEALHSGRFKAEFPTREKIIEPNKRSIGGKTYWKQANGMWTQDIVKPSKEQVSIIPKEMQGFVNVLFGHLLNDSLNIESIKKAFLFNAQKFSDNVLYQKIQAAESKQEAEQAILDTGIRYSIHDGNKWIHFTKENALGRESIARASEPKEQRIIGTALNIGGEILKGPEPFSSHQDILAHHGGVGGILEKTGEIPDLNKQGGFLTNEGFVSRKEATDIAKAAGQIPESYTGELHSQVLTEQGGEESIARAAEPREQQPYKPTKREEKILTQADVEAAKISNQIFSNITPKQAEQKQVRGQQLFKGVTPQEVEYLTRTKTQTAIDANDLVNKNGGALAVARELQKDPQGKKFSITEDVINEKDFGPNARLRAVYDNVSDQLNNIIQNLNGKEVSIAVKSELYDLFNAMRTQPMWIGNEGGSFNAQVGFHRLVEGGKNALRQFKEAILNTAEKVIGKKAKEQMAFLASEVNSLMNEENSFKLTNDPRIIRVMLGLIGLTDNSKFAKNYKKTVVQFSDKLKSIVNNASAFAAEALGNSDSSFAKADKFVEYLIKQMAQPGAKEPNSPDEHSVVLSALSKMTRNIMKEMGLVEDHPKFTKLSDQQKILAILKNEDLYSYFTNTLREEQIAKFGDSQQANELFGKLSNRMWEPDMVKNIVNEKLREINETFADIVKKPYSEGDFSRERIAEGIRNYLKENGVENEHLVDQLVNDIEKQFDESMEAARAKFFTSSKTLRQFLKSAQTNLAEVARQHWRYTENFTDSFAQTLVNEFYFPSDANGKPGIEARQIASVMQEEFNKLVTRQRTAILERFHTNWIRQQEAEKKRALNPTEKKQLKGATERILELSNLGVMRSEDVYKALQEKFGLPEYSEQTARTIEALGDEIAASKSERQKDELKQKLSNFITSIKGLPTSSSYLSWMYYSMLFGIGTFAVNAGGNAANLLGYLGVEAIKNPTKLPRMLTAMMRAAMGPANLEAKYSWFTGMQLGKDGNKFFTSKNPLELPDVRFNSDTFLKKFGPKGAELDERMANFVHKVARGVKAQYVGRAMAATDLWFYKIAQEMAYAARVDGNLAGTPAMWTSAKDQAREDMQVLGKDPDGKDKLEFNVKANAIFEQMRNNTQDKIIAAQEASSEALKTTFNQEPEYFLGRIQKYIEKILENNVLGKAIVPFTKISANVTNAMLEWTPFGIARYLLVQEGNPFKLMEDGKFKKDSDIAIRALLGTGMMMALMALMKDDDEDPDGFTIFGDGPRDINKKRILMERGWKPHTFRVAGNYYSYLYMPWAMAFSIVGRRMDDHRDGKLDNPFGVQMATDAVAMMQATLHQSFLSSITDLAGAIDSPDPEAKLSKVLARMSSIPVPNIVKQIDRWIDPSLQDAQGFGENIIKEFPIARYALNPALNVFGEPIKRTTTIIPGLERFVTGERTDDEVLNLLAEKNINVPGFSKSTRIGDVPINEEQYYQYVKTAGPEIKKRIQQELVSLRMMSREAIQDRIERISTEEKKKARLALISR